MATDLRNDFTGGEQSPLMEWQLAPEVSRRSWRSLQNFMPRKQGGAFDRPGTKNIPLGNVTPRRIFPFQLSATTKMILTESMGVYDDSGLKSAGGNGDSFAWGQSRQYHPEAPWGTGNSAGVVTNSTTAMTEAAQGLDSARLIRQSQYLDLVWRVHPSFPPHQWARTSPLAFTGSEMNGAGVPFRFPEVGPKKESPHGPFVRWLIPNQTLSAGATIVAASTSLEWYKLRLLPSAGFVGTVSLQRSYALNSPAWETMEARSTWTGETFIQGASNVWGVLQESPTYRIVVTRTAGTIGVEMQECNLASGLSEDTTLRVTSIAPSGSAGGASFGVQANARIFPWLFAPRLGGAGNASTQTNDGALIRLIYRRDVDLSLGLSASGVTSELKVQGNCAITTSGVWHGRLVVLQLNKGTGAYEPIATYSRNGDSNVAATLVVDGVQTLKLQFTDLTGTPSGTPTARLVPLDPTIYCTLRIVAILNGWFAYCIPVDGSLPDNTNPTNLFQFSAWNRRDGYPGAVGFHEGRLLMAGTNAQPTTIWASQIDKFDNFSELTSLDTSPLEIKSNSGQQNRVLWMESQPNGLLIGTTGGEYLLSASNGAAITPTNRTLRKQSDFGSDDVQAIRAGDAIVFAQRGGMELMESGYVIDSADGRERQVSGSLSSQSEHLYRSGVKELAFAAVPSPHIFAVMQDGSLAMTTYARRENVVAFWRWQTAGAVKSIAITSGPAAEADEVWMLVERNGVTCLEWCVPSWWKGVTGKDFTKVCHLDSWEEYAGTNPARFVGLPVWAMKPDGTVAGPWTGGPPVGAIQAGQGWKIGIGYERRMRPARSEFQLQSGTAQGKKMRTHAISLACWHSCKAGFIRANPSGSDGAAGTWFPIDWRRLDPFGQAGPWVTGLLPDQTLQGTHAYDGDFEIRHEGPLPLNFLAVIPSVQPYG